MGEERGGRRGFWCPSGEEGYTEKNQTVVKVGHLESEGFGVDIAIYKNMGD